MRSVVMKRSIEGKNRRGSAQGGAAALRAVDLAVSLAFLLSAGATGLQAQQVSAGALLADADRARGGVATGITWQATIEAEEDGDATSRTFLVRARGDDALVEAVAPPRHKGEIMLFNDRVIWFVKPGLRRPVSISARQRLSGDAANGDIASTHYARDYEGVLEGEEPVGGDLFKTAEFEYANTLQSSTGTFPFVSRMTIRDATGAGTVTRIQFDAPRSETYPVSAFNVNNVLR